MADSTQKKNKIWSDVLIYALMLVLVYLLYLCNHLIIFMQDLWQLETQVLELKIFNMRIWELIQVLNNIE